MTTFYSFPADFGESPRELTVGPDFGGRPATARWPAVPSTFVSGPCHFPDIRRAQWYMRRMMRRDRPLFERRAGDTPVSYHDRWRNLYEGRPSERETVPGAYDFDEPRVTRFPPSTRTVRIPVIGPLTTRGMADEDDDISMGSIRTLEATPRQVIEAEALARRSGLPLGLVLERVLGVDTAYPPGPTRTRQTLRDSIAANIGTMAGSAMAGILDRRMVTALLWGAPVFDLDDEAMREWMERMGIELPNEFQQGRYLTGQTLIDNAKTLRQRCFARLVNWVNGETGELILAHAGKHMVKPLGKRLPNMMAACRRDKKARKALSALPISRAPHSLAGDPEVIEALQDLADIVAWEARSAFTERYYPGIADVVPLTDEHVDAVMQGMQREVNRENRGKQVPYYGMLPRARQVALAERRRHWFGVFGITPKSWRTGRWSLWKVANAPFPEGYRPSQ